MQNQNNDSIRPPDPSGPRDSSNVDGLESLKDLADHDRIASYRGAKKRPWKLMVLGAGLGLGLFGAGIALFLSGSAVPVLKPMDDLVVDELTLVECTVATVDERAARDALQFTLIEAPDGAQLNPATGKFSWYPGESAGPNRYEILVGVARAGAERPDDTQRFAITVNEVNQPPRLTPIENQAVEIGVTLALAVDVQDPDVPAQTLTYALGPDAPSEATLDSQSGQFSWTPPATWPDGVVHVTVQVADSMGASAEQGFDVTVAMPLGPIDQFVDAIHEQGATIEFSDRVLAHPFSAECRVLNLGGEQVVAFEYATSDGADHDNTEERSRAFLDAYANSPTGTPPACAFKTDRLAVYYAGSDATALKHLNTCLGEPFFSRKAVSKPSVKTTPDAAESVEAKLARSMEESDQLLYEKLFEKHKLFIPSTYPDLRKVFADRFEAEHLEEIRQSLGPDAQEMLAWLDEHATVKEELYIALDPEYDNIPAALGVLNTLRQQFPDELASYGNLAIAAAVNWDDEKNGVYNHAGRARYAKAVMPDGQMDVTENFGYYLKAERFMQGRTRFLPWEFLVHVLNHKTPLDERGWAIREYFPKRTQFGKCYGDVPYDTEFLNTIGQPGGAVTKLDGQSYTLKNIRDYGGVCAQRGDFACRVGKSIGVPAASVTAPSRNLGLGHAWVIWVELKGVTSTSIVFSLEEHGRGDRERTGYYVGRLQDPHTGQKITDRQLELRLYTVGVNPRAKRQAELIMRAYPMFREKAKMDVPEQLLFLNRVIELCPGNEEAWRAVAGMSRDGIATNKHNKVMTTMLDKLFQTFANFPDFTWVIFTDLITFQDVPKQRAMLFGRLIQLYQQAKRPDLASAAVLAYADDLVENEEPEKAIAALATLIKMFPKEGQYVPRMLDKLEATCDQVEGTEANLVHFYQEFLPTIPYKPGKKPSPYLEQMFERGIACCNRHGQNQLAQAFEFQLERMRALAPAGQ